jgi:hypothetical protein
VWPGIETPGGETESLSARHAVRICTGSRADLAEARPSTSREVSDLAHRALVMSFKWAVSKDGFLAIIHKYVNGVEM